MKIENFFGRYANLPMNQRFVSLNNIKFGIGYNMSGIYNELKMLEDEMQSRRIREDELLKTAEEYFDIFDKANLEREHTTSPK
jgi:hypothetical protein